MSIPPTLLAKHLTKSYKNRCVLNDVSLKVHPGEVVGLLGPNGAGKTTAFKLILGLEPPDAGTVTLGQSLDRLPLYKRARAGLGYLPQTSSIFSQLSVRDNIRAILEIVKDNDVRNKTAKLLEQFGLKTVADQKAGTLSGGERRKLEFARALCSTPQILLVDEPFAAVDPIAAEELVGVMRNLVTKNIGILLTDHSVRKSLNVCDRVYLIVNGVVIESGTSEEIRSSDSARSLYLGNDV